MMTESGQEVFEAIGMLRYYNIHHLKKGSDVIPKHITAYRLGKHLPGEEPDIEIVTIQNE